MNKNDDDLRVVLDVPEGQMVVCARCRKPGNNVIPLMRVGAFWHPECWELHDQEMREYDRKMIEFGRADAAREERNDGE